MTTMRSEAAEIPGTGEPGRMVTPEFSPLAEFAGFGAYEAVAIRQTGASLAPRFGDIAAAITNYIVTRPETAALVGGPSKVSTALVKEWLERTSTGPFDGEFAGFLGQAAHLPGGEVTFPGVQVPLPPQLVVALLAWVQGELLDALAEGCTTPTLSAAGSAWMDQFMLQLSIMLGPQLAQPDGPLGQHAAAEFHPYAKIAGLGPEQTQILRKTGPLLEHAAGGVVTVAYNYLLSRPESAGYFRDAPHLAQRKLTLKAWWGMSTTRPMDGDFHAYMSRVADAHVRGGGEYPNVVIPPELTIALMGWVQMRVMTALNTIAPGNNGEYVFGKLPEPAAAAQVGKAWMRMLTLQLGILLKPYLPRLAA